MRCVLLLALLSTLGVDACRSNVTFDEKGCDTDDECPLPSLHCDKATASCVPCMSDTHCLALGTGLSRCDLNANRCIECVGDADCGAGRICRFKKCVTPCSREDMSGVCPIATPHCEEDIGFCIRCEDDHLQCTTADAPGPVCNFDIGRCVACVKTSDCKASEATPMCDAYAGKCVQCLTSRDCPDTAPVCDPSVSRCVQIR